MGRLFTFFLLSGGYWKFFEVVFNLKKKQNCCLRLWTSRFAEHVAVSPPEAVTLQVYWPLSAGVQLRSSNVKRLSFWNTFTLSASLSSRGLLSFNHVAVTPAPELARASNTAFSPAEMKMLKFQDETYKFLLIVHFLSIDEIPTFNFWSNLICKIFNAFVWIISYSNFLSFIVVYIFWILMLSKFSLPNLEREESSGLAVLARFQGSVVLTNSPV